MDPHHVCFQMSQQSSTSEQAPWASSPGKRQGFQWGLEFPNEALGLVWEEGEALPGEGNPTREIFFQFPGCHSPPRLAYPRSYLGEPVGVGLDVAGVRDRQRLQVQNSFSSMQLNGCSCLMAVQIAVGHSAATTISTEHQKMVSMEQKNLFSKKIKAEKSRKLIKIIK